MLVSSLSDIMIHCAQQFPQKNARVRFKKQLIAVIFLEMMPLKPSFVAVFLIIGVVIEFLHYLRSIYLRVLDFFSSARERA